MNNRIGEHYNFPRTDPRNHINNKNNINNLKGDNERQISKSDKRKDNAITQEYFNEKTNIGEESADEFWGDVTSVTNNNKSSSLQKIKNMPQQNVSPTKTKLSNKSLKNVKINNQKLYVVTDGSVLDEKNTNLNTSAINLEERTNNYLQTDGNFLSKLTKSKNTTNESTRRINTKNINSSFNDNIKGKEYSLAEQANISVSGGNHTHKLNKPFNSSIIRGNKPKNISVDSVNRLPNKIKGNINLINNINKNTTTKLKYGAPLTQRTNNNNNNNQKNKIKPGNSRQPLPTNRCVTPLLKPPSSMTPPPKTLERMNLLLSKAKEKEDKIKKQQQEILKIKKLKELEGCTFQPKINNKFQSVRKAVLNSPNEMDIYKRHLLWQNKKVEK